MAVSLLAIYGQENTSRESIPLEASATNSVSDSSAGASADEEMRPTPPIPINITIQEPAKSIFSRLNDGLVGVLGIIFGAFLTFFIQRAKINEDRLDSARKYRLERLRDIIHQH